MTFLPQNREQEERPEEHEERRGETEECHNPFHDESEDDGSGMAFTVISMAEPITAMLMSDEETEQEDRQRYYEKQCPECGQRRRTQKQ